MGNDGLVLSEEPLLIHVFIEASFAIY